ncbi:MAG: hypothetical protein J5903_02795, partial [Clostridia bacterium]|nr:hypothetical protein [Clostridia bacterium]
MRENNLPRMDRGAISKAIIIFLYVIAAALAALFTYLKATRFYEILFALAGCAAAYFSTVLLHEVGHLVFGAANGIKTLVFSVGAFSFDLRYERRLKFVFGDYAGKTDMIPVKYKEDMLSGYKATVFGGLLFGAIAAAAFFAAYFVVGSVWAKLFFSGFTFAFVSVILNSVPRLIPTSDASVLRRLKDTSFAEEYGNYLKILFLLYDGKSFSEMPEELFVGESEDTLLCALSRAEEEDDKGNIARIAAKFDEDIISDYTAT